MEKKKLFKGSAALVLSALMATSGLAVLPVSAATVSSASSVGATSVSASFSALSAYKLNLNQSFSTAVSVSSGTASYTYKFGYKKGSTTTYVKTVTSASTYMTYNYKFPAAGSYVPVVVITDANNTKVTKQLSTVTVKDFKTDFGRTSAPYVNVNTAFTTTCSVSGGTAPYTYKFGYTADGKTTYVKTTTLDAPYTTSNYKFSAAGTYTPVVQVTDADGVKTTGKLADNVTVKNFTVAFGKTSAAYVNVNTGFSTTASVSGGTAPYTYKYSYTVNGKTTSVKSVKTDAPYYYYTYKFPTEGAYTLAVEVVDVDGVRVKGTQSNITVENLTANFSKLSAPYVNVNTAFSTATSVSGGVGPYTYKFGYTANGKTVNVASKKVDAPYTTYNYKFTAAGSYVPFVEVVDANGVRTKSTLPETVVVKEFTADFSRISAPYVNVNTAFTTACSVSGGDGTYTYKFGYTLNGKTTYVKTLTTGAPYTTYNYKFTAAGSYVPFVEVVDADGVRTKTVFSEPVTVKEFTADFSRISAPAVNVNTAFTTACSVSGGTGAYTYKFGYTLNGKTTYVKTLTTGAPYTTYNYKFPAAGSYVPFVEVADADGVRTKTVFSEAVLVEDFKADFGKLSPENIRINTGFSTSCSVSGGTGAYTYKYGYILNGKTTYVYTTTSGSPYMYYTYWFSTPGTYTLTVDVVDANGVRVNSKLSTPINVSN